MPILPFFSMQGYSIANHTTSQLGAQKTPNAWIMNSVLSMMMFKIEGLSNLKGIWQRMIFIISFGWMIYEFSGNLRK